jgi:hypothetical protein
MWDIGWRSIAVAFIFLLDLIVFADLVQAELADARARRAAAKHARPPAAEYDATPAGVMDGRRTGAV